MTNTPKAHSWIIGIDEVGRGPLAGPVYVCGVAMKVGQYKKARWKGLTDSKQMRVRAREVWYARAKEMKANGEIRFVFASRSAARIDTKGISVCIRECIAKILKDLLVDPKDTQVLLDGGLKAPSLYIDQKTVIKGDQKHKIISLASVVAKVTRDAVMVRMAKKYPYFGWEQNKGYGTKVHILLIKKVGISPEHRITFLTSILDKSQ